MSPMRQKLVAMKYKPKLWEQFIGKERSSCDEKRWVKLVGYLEARELTKDKGGLPSNVLHEKCMRGFGAWERGVYPAWAREILVYPAKGGRFKKGEDIVDSKKDEKGRRWILPAGYVPEEATGRERVGLFVNPEDVTEENGKVVIHPKSLVVLHPFIQRIGWGKIDERTGIPLDVGKPWKELSFEERRAGCMLYRIRGVGVRPLVRGCSGYIGMNIFTYYFEKDVVAHFKPGTGLAAAYVLLEETAPRLKLNVSLQELGKLLRDADASLAELSNDVPHHKLEALQKLSRAVDVR